MSRNVEEIFGGVVSAPHQIPYTYNSVNGGETFISLPFYPVTGLVTINSGVQVPLDNFEIDGNTLNLGTPLEPGDVVFCLFDKVISPQDTASAVRIFKFLTLGGETTFTPDFTAYGVQSLYVDGKYKTPINDYSYSKTTGVVTMTSPLVAGVWVVAEMSIRENVGALGGNEGASKVGTNTGSNVQQELDNLGQWLPDAISICTLTADYPVIKVRGFYAANDGGEGVWKKTGVTDVTKASQHLAKQGKLYNATGVEYQLYIYPGAKINARSNGAIAPTSYTDVTNDFVCIGDVVNGITSRIKSYDATTKPLPLTLVIDGKYRHGKSAIVLWSNVVFDFTNANVTTNVAASLRTPGFKLNLFQFGIEEVVGISNFYTGKANYGQLTNDKPTIIGGMFVGDHTITKAENDCYAGHWAYVLNTENMQIVNRPEFYAYSYGLMYMRMSRTKYYDYAGVMKDGVLIPELETQSLGSYEGLRIEGLNGFSCRRGVFRNGSNWSGIHDIHFSNLVNWNENPSGNQMDYLVENYAAGAVYTGVIGSYEGDRYQPKKATVCDIARGTDWTGIYVEYQRNFLQVVPANMPFQTNARGGLEKGLGLNLDLLASQFRGSKEVFLSFSDGYFGKYLDDRTWKNPSDWSQFPSINGINFMRIGSPVPDYGAFPDGGYDFKYGTYNIGYTSTRPDVDSLRNTPMGNEFLTPYGLVVNGGAQLRLTVGNPSLNSNIVIWIKDLTGNFDPRGVSLWTSSNSNETNGDVNTWIAYGEYAIDFGNGYKAIVITNHRFNANNGRKAGWSQDSMLFINVASGTPIYLKAIQAYVGGIPFFPTGLPGYTPKGSLTQMWGTENTSGGMQLFGQYFGGGIFKPGDIVEPWIYVVNNNANLETYQQITTYGINNETLLVQGGGAYGGATLDTVNATVISYDATLAETTIEIATAAECSSVVMGAPIYVNGVSYHISTRLSNADGTLTRRYTVRGNLGSAGDAIEIKNNSLSYQTRSYVSKNLTGVTGAFTTGGDITTTGGKLKLGASGSAGAKSIEVYPSGGSTPDAYIGFGYASGSTYTTINSTQTRVSGLFAPVTTNTSDVGSVNQVFRNGFFQNALTVISDANHKPVVDSLPDALLDAFDTLKIKQWKYDWAIDEKGEENARWHTGLIAQEVIVACNDVGIDPLKYAFLVYREWENEEAIYTEITDVPEVLDEETGEVLQEATYKTVCVKEAVVAGSRWELVPHEIQFILNACMQRKLAKLEKLLSK